MKAATLINKVIRARTNAATLYHQMRHLRLFAKRIGRILKDRQSQQPATDQNTIETITEIAESLRQCEICLQQIEEELNPLDVMGTKYRSPDFLARIKWVCSEPFIRSQQSLIATHLDNLNLDLKILQSLDQSATLNAIRALARALTQNASDQQVNLSHLERPGPDDDAPTHINEPPSDSEDPVSELSKYCPECQRLNIVIPDSDLTIAVKYRQADRVQQLISEGQDATIEDPYKWSLLHHSTHLVDVQTTFALLEAPSLRELVDAKTRDCFTALMHVAGQADADGSWEIAEALIRSGSDVNIQDESEDKRTALWWAVDGSYSTNRERLINILVRAGANVDSVRSGKLENQAKMYSALETAAERADEGNEEVGEAQKDGIRRRLTEVLTNDG